MPSIARDDASTHGKFMTVQSLNITNSCTNENRFISGLADIFCYVSILLKLAENCNEY